MAPLCTAESEGRGATLYEARLILWMMTDAPKPASIRTMAMTMRAATASAGGRS
jgi:hypothetical protein